MRIVVAILAVIWALLGFVLWVPLLTRALSVSTVAIAAAALSGRPLTRAREAIRHALQFYPSGFRIIFDLLREPAAEVPEGGVAIWRLIGESLFALAFWFTTALALLAYLGELPSLMTAIDAQLSRVASPKYPQGAPIEFSPDDASTTFSVQHSAGCASYSNDYETLIREVSSSDGASSHIRLSLCNRGEHGAKSAQLHVWYTDERSSRSVRWSSGKSEAIPFLSPGECADSLLESTQAEAPISELFEHPDGTFFISFRRDEALGTIPIRTGE